jgi:hypothetical protein
MLFQQCMDLLVYEVVPAQKSVPKSLMACCVFSYSSWHFDAGVFFFYGVDLFADGVADEFFAAGVAEFTVGFDKALCFI